MTAFQHKLQKVLQYFNADQMEKARVAGKKLLKHNPRDPSLLQLLGEVAWQQGKNKLAEDYFRKAISANPSDHQAFHRFGNALAANQQIDDAIACDHSAVQTMQNYWQSLVNRW